VLCHTYKLSWVTHMSESCHTYEWVIQQTNEPCHIYEWAMSYIWMSHVISELNELCHTNEWVTVHAWVSHVTHEWIMSCAWKSHKQINKPSHPQTGHRTNKRGIAHHKWIDLATHEWVISQMHQPRVIHDWDIAHVKETWHITNAWVKSHTYRTSPQQPATTCTT